MRVSAKHRPDFGHGGLARIDDSGGTCRLGRDKSGSIPHPTMGYRRPILDYQHPLAGTTAVASSRRTGEAACTIGALVLTVRDSAIAISTSPDAAASTLF